MQVNNFSMEKFRTNIMSVADGSHIDCADEAGYITGSLATPKHHCPKS